jgi:hypothetical protein
MKFGICAGLALVLLAGSTFVPKSFAQGKNKMESKGTTNMQGKVGKVDKDTITVLVGNSPKPVMVNSDTKFLMGHTTDNKPGSLADIKQGNFISCTVMTDAKANIVAKQCLYRDKE